MTQRTQALLREALALPVEERATVAAELLASMRDRHDGEDAETVRAAWAAEIERRARRVLGGDSTGESWAAVRERTARRIADL